MRLALYQPDIPPNAGTILRLCACLGIAVDIIEPCGFALGDRAFRRAGLDYLDSVSLRRHTSWTEYRGASHGRLVLLTTHARCAYTAFSFHASDTIMLGARERRRPDRSSRRCRRPHRDSHARRRALAQRRRGGGHGARRGAATDRAVPGGPRGGARFRCARVSAEASRKKTAAAWFRRAPRPLVRVLRGDRGRGDGRRGGRTLRAHAVAAAGRRRRRHGRPPRPGLREGWGQRLHRPR